MYNGGDYMKIFLSIIKCICISPLILLDILLSITLFCLILSSVMLGIIGALLSRSGDMKTILKDYYNKVILKAAKQSLLLIRKDLDFIISDT